MLYCYSESGASRPSIMVARQAVLLTLPKSPRSQKLLLYNKHLSATCLESTLLEVFILKNFILPKMNTFEKTGEGWGVMVNQLFLRSNSTLPQSFHLPYALPCSVSRISFDCHSYENTRGVGIFFPFWNSALSHLHGSLFFLTVNFQLSTVNLPPVTSHQSQVTTHFLLESGQQPFKESSHV